MIDSTRPDAVLADTVIDALGARSFALTVVGHHAIATRDATRVVVPGPGRTVPQTFVRRLEHALRPVLGPGWIDGPPDTVTGPTDTAAVGDVLVLDAVVDPVEGGAWCAFLPAEISVMGTGAERDDALRDLKAAAALWLGVPIDRVVLMTPGVL